MTGIILDSDSVPAHQALIASINRRVPEESRRVFDGPSEFQHKHGTIRSVMRAYREASDDDSTRAVLKEDLLTVMQEYTGNGIIAESVRAGYYDWMARGFNYPPQEVGEVKKIVSDLITEGLAAKDMEIVGAAENIVFQSLAGNNQGLVEKADPLALDRSEILLAVLDA